MKKMYKATAVMGFATFVSMAVGVFKAKTLALILGPVGLGIFAQGMTFFLSGETICELGISTGVTKYVSWAWSKRDKIGVWRIVRAAISLQSISFAIFFAAVLTFSKAISQFVFSSMEYASTLVLISLAVPFSSFIITLETTLLGLGRPDVHAKGRIIYNVIGVSLLISFIYTMRLKGSFLYILVNSLVSILVVYAFFRYVMRYREEKIAPAADSTVDFKSFFTRLLAYGAVMLISSSLTQLTILYVRSLLIKHGGAIANGLYQVAFGLVGYYTPFFINGVWGYLFPTLSAIEDLDSFNIEVNKGLRFILLFLTPLLIILFLLRKAIVILIFSKEFLGSLEILPLYLMGSLFFMLSYILGATYLAKRQLKAHLAVALIQNGLYLFIFTWLVKEFGLIAISISYCLTNLITCLGSLAYQSYRIKLKISSSNTRLFLLGVVFILTIFYMPYTRWPADIAKWLLLVAWAVFVIGKREKAMLISILRDRWS